MIRAVVVYRAEAGASAPFSARDVEGLTPPEQRVEIGRFEVAIDDVDQAKRVARKHVLEVFGGVVDVVSVMVDGGLSVTMRADS